MYEKSLVPLDGSKLAECALPHVMNLAKGGAVGEVILLNVVALILSYLRRWKIQRVDMPDTI